MALALYLAYKFKQLEGSVQYTAVIWMLAVHFVFALGIFVVVCRVKTRNTWRLVGVTILDHAIFSGMVFVGGSIMAPFALLPLAFIFGSGLRYGRKYGLLSWTVGVLAFMLVMCTSPYWIEQGDFRIAMSLAVALIPPYVFRLTDELAISIRTDSMTKISNVVAFDEALADLCRQLPDSGRNGALVMIDLDGFKAVNDGHGHGVGDEVLKDVARCLFVELSPVGLPARVGGDEFAVVVGELESPSVLEEALKEFQEAITNVGLKYESELGASIGIYYLDSGTSPTPKLAKKAADSLMYASKAIGKNGIETSIKRRVDEEGRLAPESL
jgi:diguanylate cyclase (GGDEF)-like protein